MFQSRYLVAIAAGVLYAAAFPKIGIAGLAWIAPGLLLFAGRGTSGKRSFKIGFAGGLAIWLTLLYWLLFIPYRWMGIPFGPALGWLVLSGFLALYTGTWLAISIQLQERKVPERNSSWWQRTSWALLCAVLWVAMDMARARLLSGFPWAFIGVSQYEITPLIQLASVTGVYGITFLIVWFSASLLNAANILTNNPSSYRSLMAEVFLPLLAVVSIALWGFSQITQKPITPGKDSQKTVRLALIQPSIPQEVIWDAGAIPARFEKLMNVSQAALAEKPDILVWPEAAMPGFSAEHFSTITNMIVQNNVWMILGADDAERKLGGNANDFDFFNASLLFNPQGDFVASYRKLRLVMFGEYVPFTRWMPFLKWFTPVDGGFTPGKGPVQFKLDELGVQTTVLICFEDIFPHHTGRYVQSETDFLLNLTNDGWFGRSASQWQHAVTALFRAVENGIPLVRCTNNGLTCWIDEFGRLREFHGQKNGDVYSAGYLICEIPVGNDYRQTFYNRHGDWFGWACVGIAALSIVSFLPRRKKTN